jgi:hypothetical protein
MDWLPNRQEFLEILFQEYYRYNNGFILVRRTWDVGETGNIIYYPNAKSLGAATFAADEHVFFGVCPREKRDPGKEHVHYFPVLWATLDSNPSGYSGKKPRYTNEREMKDAVDAFNLKPSIIVKSGSGMHLYWLLSEARKINSPESLEYVLDLMYKRFGCETRSSIATTLRLPNTWNRRYKRAEAECKVIWCDPNLRYTGKDIRKMSFEMSGISTGQPSRNESEKEDFEPTLADSIELGLDSVQRAHKSRSMGIRKSVDK